MTHIPADDIVPCHHRRDRTRHLFARHEADCEPVKPSSKAGLRSVLRPQPARHRQPQRQTRKRRNKMLETHADQTPFLSWCR
jgi:hypothetical protein